MKKAVQSGVVGLLLVTSALLLIQFFEQIPLHQEGSRLGIDWFPDAIRNGNLYYEVTDGIRNPPWSLIPVLPLGFLSDRAGWGMLVYLNLLVLLVSVPRVPPKWRYHVAVVLLGTSYPAVRTSVDGNFEILVTLGALLIVWGYRIKHPAVLAAGILTITAKPQSSFLLLAVLGIYMLQTWSRRDILLTILLVAAVVLPTAVWRGREWLEAVDGFPYRGTLIDASLDAALLRTGIVPIGVRWLARAALGGVILWLAWRGDRTLSREKVGLLLAASLLVSPYAAGNSVLAVVAVGIIPLFFAEPKVGLLLLFLVNVPYFFTREQLHNNQAYYWTAWLLVVTGLLARRLYQAESENAIAQDGISSAIMPQPE